MQLRVQNETMGAEKNKIPNSTVIVNGVLVPIYDKTKVSTQNALGAFWEGLKGYFTKNNAPIDAKTGKPIIYYDKDGKQIVAKNNTANVELILGTIGELWNIFTGNKAVYNDSQVSSQIQHDQDARTGKNVITIVIAIVVIVILSIVFGIMKAKQRKDK